MPRSLPRTRCAVPRSLVLTLLATLAIGGATLLVDASPAHAQETDEDRFERVIGDALRAYNEGRYDDALDLYFEAKVVQDLAEIDYSIARTYHNLGQCEQAEKFYDKAASRLDELPEAYEAKIAEHVASLPETCIPPEKPEEVEVVEPVEPIKPVEPVEPIEPVPPVDSGGGVDWLSIGIMSGGAAVLLAGMAVDLASTDLADEHSDLKSNPDSGTVEDRQARIAELEDEIGTRKAIIYSLYGVGGAALVTGTVLLFVRMDWDDDADGTAWQLEPTFGQDQAGMLFTTQW